MLCCWNTDGWRRECTTRKANVWVMKGANILIAVSSRIFTISLSSSLKLSRLPPPDLRITCSVKSAPNYENQQVHQKNLVVLDRRRNNRLARAITPPTLIAARNGHTPSSFDFFETRRDKRCCFALWSRAFSPLIVRGVAVYRNSTCRELEACWEAPDPAMKLVRW